jgi:mono/diheme cytochrome c family protein
VSNNTVFESLHRHPSESAEINALQIRTSISFVALAIFACTPIASIAPTQDFTDKGGQARLSHQIAAALNADMGIKTDVFPQLDGGTGGGTAELPDSDLADMIRYVATLGVSARRDLDDAQALQGEQLFASAGCAKCHAPTLSTSCQ